MLPDDLMTEVDEQAPQYIGLLFADDLAQKVEETLADLENYLEHLQ